MYHFLQVFLTKFLKTFIMKNLVQQVFNPENDFFLLTKDAKRLTHISLSSFILPVVFLMLAGILVKLLLEPLVLGNTSENPKWINDVFELTIMFGVIIGIVFLWVRFFEGRKISSLGFIRNGAINRYLAGFISGIIINTIVVGLMALFGNIELAKESANITGTSALGLVGIYLLGFLVQGASEEILTRGWMMQIIGSRYKPWLGVLLSTLLFAILHLGNAGVNPISVINLILVSFLLALFVLNDGSLWFACAWHSSWNWMLGNVYGLSVSGQGEKITLVDLNTKGSEILSGGGFGPEGSIITTIVMIFAIIWYLIKLKNNNIAYNPNIED